MKFDQFQINAMTREQKLCDESNRIELIESIHTYKYLFKSIRIHFEENSIQMLEQMNITEASMAASIQARKQNGIKAHQVYRVREVVFFFLLFAVNSISSLQNDLIAYW